MAFLTVLSLHLYRSSNKNKSHSQTVNVIGLSLHYDLYWKWPVLYHVIQRTGVRLHNSGCSFLSVVFGKPLVTFVFSHGLKRNTESIGTLRVQIIINIYKYKKKKRKEKRNRNIALKLQTLLSNSFPLGSTMESCLKASSPTKQISWPSWKENDHVNIINGK